MKGPITGYHMTAVFVGFFGLVAAVNFVMAAYATQTFGGTVVDNSYVASQNFNEWLETARQQEALGWTETVVREGARVAVAVESGEGAVGSAIISATARHPLGRAEPVRLSFAEVEPGQYRSVEALPSGRWIVQLEIVRNDDRKRVMADLS
jgi:nitrogen fixation protein FixH